MTSAALQEDADGPFIPAHGWRPVWGTVPPAYLKHRKLSAGDRGEVKVCGVKLP